MARNHDFAVATAAGRLPLLGNGAGQPGRADGQGGAAWQPHRLAVEQDAMALVGPFDRGNIPESLHQWPFIEKGSSGTRPDQVRQTPGRVILIAS